MTPDPNEVMERLTALAEERSCSDDVWEGFRDAIDVIRKLNARAELVNLERNSLFHQLNTEHRMRPYGQGGC